MAKTNIRQIRKAVNLNPAEELLALHLEELGVEFKRQHQYAAGRKLAADFALPKYWLLIEVVGGVYTKQAHGSVTGVLADNDRLNAATLNGWVMLRFTPNEVKDGTAKVIVKAFVEEVLT